MGTKFPKKSAFAIIIMFKRWFGQPRGSGTRGGSRGGDGRPGSTSTGRAAFDAVDKLKDTLEMLNKREALLIKKISNELEKAREFNRQGNKRAALQCLKRKKLYESQCEVVANQQLKLQEQMIVLEGSKATAELDALDVEDALLQKEIEELEPGFTTQSKEEVVVMPDVPKMKPVPKMPVPKMPANVKKIASTEEEE